MCKQLINNMIFDQTTSSISNEPKDIRLRVSGFIRPLTAGTYYFYCVSNGVCTMYINGLFIGKSLDVLNGNFYLSNPISLNSYYWFPIILEYENYSMNTDPVYVCITTNMDNGTGR